MLLMEIYPLTILTVGLARMQSRGGTSALNLLMREPGMLSSSGSLQAKLDRVQSMRR